MFDAVSAERFVTARISSGLGLAIDDSLFRGKLPVRSVNAASVTLESLNVPSGRRLFRADFQFYARYLLRDDAVLCACRIRALLPVYSACWWMDPSGDASVYETSWEGKTVWAVSFNFFFFSSIETGFSV